MKFKNRTFLNSPLILTMRLFGVFPINPDTLECSRFDVIYCGCLGVLSILELLYTPVFIIHQKDKLVPANFPATTTIMFIQSTITSIAARYTALHRVIKYFPRINDNIIKTTSLLYTHSLADEKYKRERALLINRLLCIFIFIGVVGLNVNRVQCFIRMSEIIGDTIYFVYFIMFQNSAVLLIEIMFLRTVAQLNLNFSKINKELELILEETELFEKQAQRLMCKVEGAEKVNKDDKSSSRMTSTTHGHPIRSPYVWPSSGKSCDSTLKLNIEMVGTPEIFPMNTLSRLKRLFFLHIQCSEAVESSNSLFEVQLLFSVFRLFCVSFLVVYQHLSRYVEYGFAYTVLIYVYIFFIILRSTLLTSSAGCTISEAQYTKVLITKINNRFLDVDTKEELDLFWEHITSSKLEFTACGFFTLNTRLIASAFVAGTTYLVILLQFNPEKQNMVS
ncbi:unnamed protein product [Bemisia tabaci]|uniref:Gustatory receptor n=1 Tax=Bemisia tabaci TaxID=7038 RepID=A0A9P0AFR2_BEMTA|nr:unnamed protein product [Bemisia tabaci]